MRLCYSTSPEEFLARLSAHEDTKKEPVATKQKDFSLPGNYDIINHWHSSCLLSFFTFYCFILLALPVSFFPYPFSHSPFLPFFLLRFFLLSLFSFPSSPSPFLSFFLLPFSLLFLFSLPSRIECILFKNHLIVTIIIILFYRTSSRWWIWRCRS